jgi:hypothetical protein
MLIMNCRQKESETVCSNGKPRRLRNSFRLADNLRRVHLSSPFLSGLEDNHKLCFLTEFPLWIKGCKAFSKVTVQLDLCQHLLNREMRDRIVQGIMRRLHKKISVQGRLVKIDESIAFAELWEWRHLLAPT